MYINFLQEMSNIDRVRYRVVSSRVLGGNVSWDLKMMSTIESVRYKVSATNRFCYESLTNISSVPEKSDHCREVFAIKDVRYKEVSR